MNKYLDIFCTGNWLRTVMNVIYNWGRLLQNPEFHLEVKMRSWTDEKFKTPILLYQIELEYMFEVSDIQNMSYMIHP